MGVGLGSGHWSARPHLFSFVAVVLLLGLLEGERRKPVVATALLFAIWANLHGGFVYGWILILVYLIGSVGELVWGREQRNAWRERVRNYVSMLVAAVAVTILNPYGLELHRHLIEFFSTPYLMDHTAEFVSPNFHESSGKIFLILLVLCVISLSLHRPRPTLPRLLLICVGVAFALISVRNVPLFGLTALPVLALHLNDVWRRLPDPGGVRGRFGITAGTTTTLPWVLAIVLLLLILVFSQGRVGSLQLIRDEFDGSIFPVRAVAEARKRNLEGRVFSEFAWGGYLVYAWPEQKIFIDGGTDFFGEEIFREYAHIKRMSPGWRSMLARRDISLMLLEREQSFTYELARGGGWLLWYCDSLAVVLRRSAATTGVTPPEVDSTERTLDGCARRPSDPLGKGDK
jgi:hypothetical protein